MVFLYTILMQDIAAKNTSDNLILTGNFVKLNDMIKPNSKIN